MKSLRVLVTVLRTEGLGAVMHRLAFRFLRVHTFTIYRRRVSEAMPEVQPPPGIELREVTPDELRELRAGRTDLPEYFYRDETGTTGRCWAGLENGRLGFILWYTYRAESGMVRIGETDVEVAYAYCLPALRGKHLTEIAMNYAGRILGGEGIRSLLAVPHSENAAINKTFVACGFQAIGRIKRYGFFHVPRLPVDTSGMADPGREA